MKMSMRDLRFGKGISYGMDIINMTGTMDKRVIRGTRGVRDITCFRGFNTYSAIVCADLVYVDIAFIDLISLDLVLDLCQIIVFENLMISS